MPKIVDKQEKRETILEAAISVFAKKGMTKAKIAEIADAAGIGKGTIYEYFQSKEEIFSAAFYYVMKKANDIVSKRLSSTAEPLQKLHSLFDAWKDILQSEFKENIEIMLDFWAEGIRTKDKMATFSLKKIYEESRQMIKDILDECAAGEKIQPIDTRIASSIIIGTMDGLMVQWITDPDAFSIEESFETTAKIILNGLKKQ